MLQSVKLRLLPQDRGLPYSLICSYMESLRLYISLEIALFFRILTSTAKSTEYINIYTVYQTQKYERKTDFCL